MADGAIVLWDGDLIIDDTNNYDGDFSSGLGIDDLRPTAGNIPVDDRPWAVELLCLALYCEALSSEEISAHAQAGVTPVPQGSREDLWNRAGG